VKCGVVSVAHCWRCCAPIAAAVVAAGVGAAAAAFGTAHSHAGGRDSLCIMYTGVVSTLVCCGDIMDMTNTAVDRGLSGVTTIGLGVPGSVALSHAAVASMRRQASASRAVC